MNQNDNCNNEEACFAEKSSKLIQNSISVYLCIFLSVGRGICFIMKYHYCIFNHLPLIRLLLRLLGARALVGIMEWPTNSIKIWRALAMSPFFWDFYFWPLLWIREGIFQVVGVCLVQEYWKLYHVELQARMVTLPQSGWDPRTPRDQIWKALESLRSKPSRSWLGCSGQILHPLFPLTY